MHTSRCALIFPSWHLFSPRRVITSLMAFAFLANSSATRSEQVFFAIDPNQSVLQVSADIYLPAFPLTIHTAGQGTTGIAIPGFGNGTTGQLSGVVSANIDTSSNTVVFGGGSLFGVPSGQWEPTFKGATGIAPAFIGVVMQDPNLGKAVAAIRNFKADYHDAYSVNALIPSGAGNYSFTTNDWLSVATVVDVQGQTGLAALLGSSRESVSEKYAAANDGQIGSLTSTAGGQWKLHIPLNLDVYIPSGSTAVGEVDVILHIEGDITATSFTVPSSNSPITAEPGHHSFETAQSLDGHFARAYDQNVGDSLLNTSAVIPHVTIHGNWDGLIDMFKFTVTQPYSEGIFDIDGASFDTTLYLYDAFGNLLASNDDAPSSFGAKGTTHSLDAFIEYTFQAAGTYYIGVGAYSPNATLTEGKAAAALADGDYTLQVSVIPEVSSSILASLPLCGFIFWRYRRNRNVVAASMAAFMILIAGNVASADTTLMKNSIESIYDPDSTYPMPYRLFTPTDYDSSSDREYPLVLFLHGAGERGDDNFYQVASHIDGLIQATQSQQYASFLLAPQLTDYPYAGGWDPDSVFDRTMEILNQVVNEYHIDINRIYITGLSMGGFGTFDYIAEFPNLFAAAVPMSGGGSTSTASIIKDIPIWVFHGSADETVPVQYSRNMVNAITAAGGHPLYTEIPGGPHGIWDNVYNDINTNQYGLYEWMFSQSLGSNAQNLAVPEVSGLWMIAIILGGAASFRMLAKFRARQA